MVKWLAAKGRTHHKACKLSSFLKYPFRQTCYLPWRVQNSSNTVSRSNGCLIFTDLSPTTRPQSSRWRGVFRICNKREIVKFRQHYSFRLIEHSIRCVFDMISICVRPAHEGKHERRPLFLVCQTKPRAADGEFLTRFYIKVCRTRLYISSLLICESFLCATRTRIKISTYHHGIYHGVCPCYSKHPYSCIVSDVIWNTNQIC